MTSTSKSQAQQYRAAILRRDPDYYRRKQREFLARNPGYSGRYRKTPSGAAHVNMSRAKVRAKKFGRIPPWYDAASVYEVYLMAEEFRQAGFDMTVDHIIPLQHPLVCGLHVAANLRPCTREGNSKKSNQFPSHFLGYGG